MRLITLFLLSLYLFPLSAHTLTPAVLTLNLSNKEHFSLTIRTNLESWIAGISPSHKDTDDAPEVSEYKNLREMNPARLEETFRKSQNIFLKKISVLIDQRSSPLKLVQVDIPTIGDIDLARQSTITLQGRLSTFAQALSIQINPEMGAYVLRISRFDSSEVTAHWLKEGGTSPVISLQGISHEPNWWGISLTYLELGFTHILPLGADHILFVLGIFLLSTRWRHLLTQVTAFTLAHTLTLGMTMLGWIALSSAIVEPLIALSIVYVAVENIFTNRLHSWRVVIVFMFGLLHGMGFAGMLTEIGLPIGFFWNALINFNIGVELGQLTIILIAYTLLAAPMQKKKWYRGRIIIPISAVIAVIGLYWSIDRVFL